MTTHSPTLQLQPFRNWLAGRADIELLAPTSEWEALRFRTLGLKSQLGIIYVNKRGRFRYTGPSARLWHEWQRGGEADPGRGLDPRAFRAANDAAREAFEKGEEEEGQLRAAISTYLRETLT